MKKSVDLDYEDLRSMALSNRAMHCKITDPVYYMRTPPIRFLGKMLHGDKFDVHRHVKVVLKTEGLEEAE